MKEQTIYIKYDGPDADYERHQIDTRHLGRTLLGISDMIFEANRVLNGQEATVEVRNTTGFFDGSFGIEIVIVQDLIGTAKDIAPILGLTATSGSMLSVLNYLRGRKITEITYDEASGEATIESDEGNVTTSPEVAKLISSAAVRKGLDQVIAQPLDDEGTGSFEILESKDSQQPLFKVEKNDRAFYKHSTVKSTQASETETIATIEFVNAHSDSGSKGWRMVHLGEESAVKVKDESFLEMINRPDAASPFGHKFKVELLTRLTKKLDGSETKTYSIIKVLNKVPKDQ